MHEPSQLIHQEKQLIRERLRTQIRAVPVHDRRELSRRAVFRLLEREEFRTASQVMGYIALKDELDIFAALEWGWAAGKRVALPRYVPHEQRYCASLAEPGIRQAIRGAFGVVEPSDTAEAVPLKLLDFVLVPGLAFDPAGRRLGRGRGFYDRLLAEVTGIKCGVALDEQIVDRLPSDAHDIGMNFILTPTRWLPVRSTRNALS